MAPNPVGKGTKTMGLVFLIAAFVSANAATLPFSETFDALSDGPLGTNNGWEVQSGTADVQTNVVQQGKSVELTEAVISHDLSSSNALLWLTFWARYTEVPEQNPAITDTDISVAFYINTNQNLVVYSNTAPVTLDTVIPTNSWTRFDVYCDYEALTWNLSVNQTNVSAGLPLYSGNTTLASVQIENASTSPVYVDTLSITDYEPVEDVMDTDNDDLPDWWEQKFFGGITNAVATAAASNGVNTLEEVYIAGLNPDSTERFEITGAMGSTSTLQWVGQPARRYAVYATPDLLAGFTFQTNVLWSEAQYTDLTHTNEPSMFFQVRVELEPGD